MRGPTVQRNAPLALFLASITLFAASNFFYTFFRDAFVNVYSDPTYVYVSLLIICTASVLLSLAAFTYFRVQQKLPFSTEKDSGVVEWRLGRIFSDALYQHKTLFSSSVVIYATFFALLDGILIYQPGVDFSKAYAVIGPTWRVETCCGLPGYVPVGLFYLPAQHTGLELIPMSILLMIFVSALVGLNICLLRMAYSLSKTQNLKPGAKGSAGGIVGAVFGLFVGCPTCAAAFLLSMFAGTGAIGFSSFIAAYQPLIAAFTLPLLFLSILWQGRSIRKILAGCASAQIRT
jgi:hypothetical protein